MRSKKEVIIWGLSIITIAALAFSYYQNEQIIKNKTLSGQHANEAAAARVQAEKQRDVAIEALRRAQQLTSELEAAVQIAGRKAQLK